MRRNFARVSRSLSFTVICVLLFGSPSKGQEESFYKGKTLRVIAGTTAGALYDQWARVIAAHIVKYIPGNPQVIVQNMPGAGHQIAANYLYNVAKPDGLTVIGSILPTLYLDQLIGRAEVKFDWGKFLFIGSPVKGDSQMMMRADAPFKTIEDMRTAKESAKCGGTGTGGAEYMFSRLLEETFPPLKINSVLGYPGGPEIDLGIERGEIQCRSFTIEAFFAREPYHTWRKKGFVRNIVQTGQARDPRLLDVPTMYEVMDQQKTPDLARRLARVVLVGGTLGRPMLAPPGVPPERLKILRGAFVKTMKDPEFLAEIEKRNYELDPTPGENLEAIVKDVMSQPPAIIERLKMVLVAK
ncbi:MAG TPA: tripartite tricarboxylate transporter substrate-binding protein [Candidatus Saccharimonadales bacterium]|nr:tripartite tricarboxylate transporter substrate-binding protein [Candidatus Saccharimonadales bacterium]